MRRRMIVVVLLMTPISMFAQGLGSIGGTVADPSGALVPGVRITATEVGTNLSRSAISDEQGRFVWNQEVFAALSLFSGSPRLNGEIRAETEGSSGIGVGGGSASCLRHAWV